MLAAAREQARPPTVESRASACAGSDWGAYPRGSGLGSPRSFLPARLSHERPRAPPALGRRRWLAALDGPLAVGTCVRLLGVAQRHLNCPPSARGRAPARAAFAAFVVQGPIIRSSLCSKLRCVRSECQRRSRQSSWTVEPWLSLVLAGVIARQPHSCRPHPVTSAHQQHRARGIRTPRREHLPGQDQGLKMPS